MQPAPGARPAGLPLPLPDEIERPRLLDKIEARWHHPVTVIAAGAGFGKSTLLAQAMRANALEPRGIDLWHGCAPGDEDADTLGRGLLAALGAESRAPDLAAHVVGVLASYSPIDVCLILDDAHEIRPGSSGSELISKLVRRLPENAHLVLAARSNPPGALTRLRAADRVLDITQGDLVFTRDETSCIARRLGRDADAATALGGWPALVRLALAVRQDVAINFAQEEVLSRLSGPERRALFALSNLGYADHDLVVQIVGADVDLEHLAATVPLISRTEGGLFRAHDLWSAALVHVLDREQTAELRARVVERLVADGDVARAGAIAMAHHDLDALARVALEMVSRTISALPIDTVRPWNRMLQQGRPDAPETRLLGAAIRHALDFTDLRTDADVDAAAVGFRHRGYANGEIVALAVGTVCAYARGDVARLVALASQAEAIPGAHDHPVINLAVHAIAAIVAEMSGDLGQALVEVRAAGVDRVPPAIGAAVNRLLIHCLLFTGQADEAVEVAQRMLAKSNDKMARYLAAIARWMAGKPFDLIALGRPTVDVPALNSRDEFVRRTIVASLLACTGQRADVHRLVESQDVEKALPGQLTTPRDAVLDAVAHALCAIVDHDDGHAARLIGDVLALHDGSPILDQHLRRFLPLGYVLNETLRAAWDAATLGPSHEKARVTSRLLVDLRANHRVSLCDFDPAHVFTALPLPWSIELACRLHANRHPTGARLATWLVDQVPEPARAELRYLADLPGDGALPQVARAASELLARLPAVPARQLEISVIGPLRVAFDGVAVAPSELRRARVRTLLALLVVHGTLSRDQAIDLLWPELDARDGARNLRVTLTYLRQLLEPERPTGEASFHLRADAATITLQPSAHLTVDLWELRRLTDQAAISRTQVEPDRTISLLATATSLWRGEPLIDLGSIAGDELEIEHVRLLHLGSLLDLGELRIARGQTAQALLDAERALALDPYSERAHRLAIAAALHGHDRERTSVVADRTMAMLDELGVEPEPATKILLRQAG